MALRNYTIYDGQKIPHVRGSKGCFVGGTYYATKKFNELLDSVMTEYEVISNKVDVFVDVSNPETIRLYTTELRKILDDITFLGRIVETGQISSENLDKFFVEYEAQLDTIRESLSVIQGSTLEEQINSTVDGLRTDINSIETRFNMVDNLITDQSKSIGELTSSLSKSIENLNKDIDAIKNSRYGKKIWELK